MKLVPLLFCGCLYGVSAGFLQPAVSLQLASLGVSNAQIAWVNASSPAALLLFSLLVPKLLRSFGVIRAFTIAMLLEALAVIALAYVDFWQLAPSVLALGAGALRIISGASNAVSWIAFESSVNNAINQRNRGRLLAIYSVAIAIGFVIGPLLLPLLNLFGSRALLLVGALLFLAMLLGLYSRVLEKWFNSEHVGAKLPSSNRMLLLVILLLGFSGGFTESFVYGILPLYWLPDIAAGLQPQYLISAFTFGSICAQIPIGWYLDRYRWQPLVLVAFSVSVLLLLAMFNLDWQSPIAILPMVLWGACIDSMFMTSLYLQGKHFRNYLLARLTSWYVAMSTIGMLAAPSGSALVFSFDGSLLLWLPTICYLIVALVVLGANLPKSRRA